MRETSLLKALLILGIILFNVNLYAGEDDATIVAFSVEQKIEAKTPDGIEILRVQMFNLYNQSQYFEVFEQNDCNENQNKCTYFFALRDLVQGQIYRIQMYISSQEEAIEINYIP